jgi:hypothetical protein
VVARSAPEPDRAGRGRLQDGRRRAHARSVVPQRTSLLLPAGHPGRLRRRGPHRHRLRALGQSPVRGQQHLLGRRPACGLEQPGRGGAGRPVRRVVGLVLLEPRRRRLHRHSGKGTLPALAPDRRLQPHDAAARHHRARTLALRRGNHRHRPRLFQGARTVATLPGRTGPAGPHSGLPMWRPCPWYSPHDSATWSIGDQFMLGDDLLVAPILTPLHERKVYLPAGAWRTRHPANPRRPDPA